jgi:uncharacterized protein YwgA
MGELKKLIALIKESGIKVNVDNFQDRLILQKLVYLLKLSGINLGYSFSLYVRGPYSPDLTKEFYEYKDTVNNLQTDYRPKKNDSLPLVKFNGIFILKPIIKK